MTTTSTKRNRRTKPTALERPADLSTLGARDQGRSPLEWTLYGAGFVATVVAVVYLNRLAHRALARYTDTGTIEANLP